VRAVHKAVTGFGAAPHYVLVIPRQTWRFTLCIDMNRCEGRTEFYFCFVKIAHSPHPARHLKDVDKGSSSFGEQKSEGKFEGNGQGTGVSGQMTLIFSSKRRLSASSEPASSKEFVIAALPFSTLVMT